MKFNQPQIAKVIIGMDRSGKLLQVQAIEDKAEFRPGGKCHGYRYEWGVNHYSYTENKETVMAAYGLTEAEYNYWDQRFIMRFDWDKEVWYEDEAVKTYLKLEG